MNRRRTPRWAIAAAVGLVCAFARTGAAQQARGVVRDSAARAPLPGAVVAIVDSTGRQGARTIADANGRFVLPLSRGAARIHVIRIGYRPLDVPLSPATPSGDVTVDVAMPRLPPVLEAVRVTDQELCPGSTDRGAAFQLWEQARAGLLSSVVAREANPAQATTMIFERTMSASNDLIRRQTTVTRNGRTTRPFIAAAPPSEFAQVGYMTENAAGRTYSAPDADVLLDESFASTHCFHLQSSDDRHRDQIGLAFAPAPRATQIVDVSGVIWIDRQAPALRSLDFLFTNLEPAATRAGVGGHLEFRSVANGVSFVEWWVMRMPNLELSAQRPANTPLPGSMGTPSRQSRTDLRVTSIQEAGGEVLEASWSDGTIWHAEPSGFTGAVKQKGLDRTIPFALVTIAGTRDTITTDERGAFNLSPVPPGKYTVVVIDTTLRAFVAERTDSREVEVVRGRLSPLRTELATIASVMADVCHGQKMRERTTSIVGRVMLSDGTLPAGIELRGRWQADFNLGSAVHPGSGAPLSIDESEQRINPDALGRFAVCGVALDRPVQLRLTRGSEVADTTIFPRDSTFTRVEWRARLRPVVVAKAPETTTPSSAQAMSPAMRVVNERRRSAPAAFVADSVLRKAGSTPLGDALRGRLSGMNIMSGSGGGTFAVATRDQRNMSVMRRDDANRPSCFATLYLDGTLLYELTTFNSTEPPSLNNYSAEQMAAVEFYSAGSVAPSQFKPSECGVLLLWTRDR